MDINDIKNKWKLLSKNESIVGYRSSFISPDCKANIFLGVNFLDNHCLILVLPKTYKLDFNTIKKEKISITLYPQTNYLVLELEDNSYYDIFDDLIISLYHVIKDIEDVDMYSKTFIKTFNKWSEFFEDTSSTILSKDSVKGLFGELFVLKDMIAEANASNINNILSGWKGPYDGPCDFIYDKKNIEVKTKYITGQTVQISSEYQLESEEGKELELLVLSVIDDMMKGKSLRELFEIIKNDILKKSGDMSIIYIALKQKNITHKNILRYDNYRFSAKEQIIYDADKDSFPKLVNSKSFEAISSIKYSLKLVHLNDFIKFRKEII